MSVRVTAPGNTAQFAIVIRILEGRKCCIQLLDRYDEERRIRYPTTLVENTRKMKSARSGKIATADMKMLRFINDVHFSAHQARQAQHLSLSQCLGAMDAASAKHTEKRRVICVDCQEVYTKKATHANFVHRGTCASRQFQAELKQKN
jgi:hypothetical protein